MLTVCQELAGWSMARWLLLGVMLSASLIDVIVCPPVTDKPLPSTPPPPDAQTDEDDVVSNLLTWLMPCCSRWNIGHVTLSSSILSCCLYLPPAVLETCCLHISPNLFFGCSLVFLFLWPCGITVNCDVNYRVNLKECPNTKIMISQKCVNIFVPNFALLFTRQLCKSMLLCAVFTWHTPN